MIMGVNLTRPSFDPWIGEDFKNQKHKIMLLGESHHLDGDGPARPPTPREYDSTIRWTCSYVRGAENHSFWSKAGTLVARFANWQDQTGQWNPRDSYSRIAFYNFLTSFVSEPRDWPDEEAVLRSRPVFVEVLDKLMPDIVIALGLVKMQWFLDGMHDVLRYFESGSSSVVAKRKQTIIVSCLHPQGRFSYAGALAYLRHGVALIGRPEDDPR